MPISPAQFVAIEDTLNRLAAESILAQPGRDEGLVPAYALLSELHERCGCAPLLLDPINAIQQVLERMLDAAQPFDDSKLNQLRTFVERFPTLLDRARHGDTIEVGATAIAEAQTSQFPAPPAATRTGSAEAPADELLALNLQENRELLAEFHAETVEHLAQIEAALLALDQEPENPEALASIFRSFHTIKGNAGFLGLTPMHTLAHEVESLLDLARNNRLRLNAAIITEILRSRDAIQALNQQIALALEKGKLPEQIVPVGHLITAVRKLAELGARTARATPLPAAEPAIAEPAPVAAAAHAPEPVRAEPPELAPVIPLPNTPVTMAEPAPASAAGANAPTPPPAVEAGAKKPGAAGGVAKTTAATVRVNTDKLDSLMDVVGELVIVQSQLIETARITGVQNTTLQRNVAQLSRITKELQSTAMALRMIPIKPTFQKMERLARDLARDFGKKVSFITSGEDTELDRTVVEEIADPLVHMVRNALDHGLEPADQRIAVGKSPIGSLHLRAYHQGSNIVIELADDGRGIDPDRILRKAIEKGVVAADAKLSRDEVLALIFMPGLSTAEKITAVSGRGVGMDVVKRNIERLRGKIETSSEVGRGTTFKVKLPLTMAIIDGLVVRVGGDKFILPSTSVQMALRPDRAHISTVHGQGEVLDLRGRFVPIHRLHRRFGIPADAANPWDGIVVIIESGGRTAALLVDEMVSKQEVVIKNLGAFMQNLPGVAGGAILGDGNIALILDPGTVLNAA